MVVLASVVFVPSAPLLVPALAGPRAFDAEPIRAATLAAAADLAAASADWVAIGAADTVDDPALAGCGTFARYGVDVEVCLRAGDHGPAGFLPLSMLIAAWLREQAGAKSVRPVVVAPDTRPAECARIGAELAADVDAAAGPVGVLVVGDGAISLSARAPGGGLREAAVDLQARIDAAIAEADLASLAALDVAECVTEGVAGRVAWQVSAALCADSAVESELRCAQAPFGVGYDVAVWTPR